MIFIYFGLKRIYNKVFGNNEFFFYSIVCAIFMITVSLILYFRSGYTGTSAALTGSFHAVSLITTTGFFIDNQNLWGNLILIIFFTMMLTGGTAGSTSGGIKIVRLLLVTINSRQELKRLIHPNAFIPVRIDKRIVPQTIIYNLLIFITLYYLVICASAFILSFMGYDMITSFSTASSMLANIGPGLSPSGLFRNYADMPETGKWFLSGLMLLGRLELLTVMVLFSRSFYRH